MADLAHQERRRRGPLVDRARAELAAGRPWMARAQLHSLMQRDPDHVEGRALLASTLREMGDEYGAEALEAGPMHGSARRWPKEDRGPQTFGERLGNAASTAGASLALTVVALIVAAPFALFGIGIYQVASWIGLW